MFNRIAKTYDRVNRILSFGNDVRWRKLLVRMSPVKAGDVYLDLGTGTGDVLLEMVNTHRNLGKAIGIDPADKMIEIGRAKVTVDHVPVDLIVGDAKALPLESQSVDLISMAFAIRNVDDPVKAFHEMLRVLKPGGTAQILEFSLPSNRLIRWVYLIYFRYILPAIGGALSGDRDAYRYLNATVELFPYGDAFTRLLTDAGFKSVSAVPFTFGIATLYRAVK